MGWSWCQRTWVGSGGTSGVVDGGGWSNVCLAPALRGGLGCRGTSRVGWVWSGRWVFGLWVVVVSGGCGGVHWGSQASPVWSSTRAGRPGGWLLSRACRAQVVRVFWDVGGHRWLDLGVERVEVGCVWLVVNLGFCSWSCRVGLVVRDQPAGGRVRRVAVVSGFCSDLAGWGEWVVTSRVVRSVGRIVGRVVLVGEAVRAGGGVRVVRRRLTCLGQRVVNDMDDESRVETGTSGVGRRQWTRQT